MKNKICIKCGDLKIWCECFMNKQDLSKYKPIKVDTSKMEKLKPVEEIKYIPKKFRENIPPLELWFLKAKRGALDYLGSKVNFALKEGVNSIKPIIWIVVGLSIVFCFVVWKYLL